MKRSLTDNLSPKRSAWQQPASCEFCRTKKIRCDKNRPCSNCASRQLSCQYVIARNTEVSDYENGTHANLTRISLLERHIAEIYGRLSRLEKSTHTVTAYAINGTPPGPTEPRNERIANTSNNAKDWEELESTVASSTPRQATNLDKSKIASQHNVVRIPSPDPAASTVKLGCGPNTHLDSGCNASDLVHQLPTVYTARLLFEYYVQVVDCMHRELHVPSARILLEESYSLLAKSLEVSREVLTFLFCIFASSSFHICHAHCHLAPKGLTDSSQWSAVWKMTASDLIYDRRVMVSTSLLSLQSVSIMLLLEWNSEGQSAEFYALKSIAYQKAISMGIHRLDAGTGGKDGNVIESELKRRLWWHLAASDWITASIPGNQEGMYSVNPAHARVTYPANLDDRVLSNSHPPVNLPEDQPTSTSFLIQRAKFAELCRQLADSIQNVGITEESQPCNLTYEFSHRLRRFEQDLPWFFRMDEENKDKANALALNRPYLVPQKHCLLFGIYSRIVRLHRPFLSMKLREPEFSESRTVCLQYAEKILKLRNSIDLSGICHCVNSYSIRQHTFGALLLLSMDSMLETDMFRAQPRKAELIEISKTLRDKEMSSNRSNSGFVFGIDKLIDLLRKSTLDTPVLDSSSSSTERTAQVTLQNPGRLPLSDINAPVTARSLPDYFSEPGHTTSPMPMPMPTSIFSEVTLDDFLNQIDGMEGFDWDGIFPV